MFLWLPLSLSKSELFLLIRFSFQNWQFSMMCDTFYNKFQRPARCPSSVQHPSLFPLFQTHAKDKPGQPLLRELWPRISARFFLTQATHTIFFYWPPIINIANLPPCWHSLSSFLHCADHHLSSYFIDLLSLPLPTSIHRRMQAPRERGNLLLSLLAKVESREDGAPNGTTTCLTLACAQHIEQPIAHTDLDAIYYPW